MQYPKIGYRKLIWMMLHVGIARVGESTVCPYDWAVGLDIKGAIVNLDRALLMEAVRTHIKEPWVLLYVERWLKAPLESVDGDIV